MPRDKTGHFYYEWFSTIFKADTQHLDPYEDGCYRRLIDHYMETKAALPADDKALARIIGIGLDDWKRAADSVRAFFKPSENPVGFLRHNFCEELLAKHNARIKNATENGKNGGRPSKNKSSKNKANNPVGSETITQRKAEQNNQNHKEGYKDNNPLTPFESGDKSVDVVKDLSKGLKYKEEYGSGSGSGSKLFDILEFLDPLDVSAAHALLPNGWGFDYLVRVYNDWINDPKNGNLPPRKPRVAFSKWIVNYTKNKPPEGKK